MDMVFGQLGLTLPPTPVSRMKQEKIFFLFLHLKCIAVMNVQVLQETEVKMKK